jgi:hypothetical protein
VPELSENEIWVQKKGRFGELKNVIHLYVPNAVFAVQLTGSEKQSTWHCE